MFYQKLFHCIIRNLSIIRKSRSTDGNIVFVFVFLFEIQNKLLGLLWNTKDYQKVYCNSDTSTWQHKRSFQVYMTLQCSTRKMVLIGKSQFSYYRCYRYLKDWKKCKRNIILMSNIVDITVHGFDTWNRTEFNIGPIFGLNMEQYLISRSNFHQTSGRPTLSIF